MTEDIMLQRKIRRKKDENLFGKVERKSEKKQSLKNRGV